MASFGGATAASPPPWMAGEELAEEPAPVHRRDQTEFATSSAGQSAPSSPLDLPEWLRDESDPAGFEFDPPELELIEDDDLPAWIPELAKTETGVYDRPSLDQPETTSAPAQRHPVVPPVSRAWLARPSARESPRAAVFIQEPEVTVEEPAAPAAGETEPAVETPAAAVEPSGDALGAAGAEMVTDAATADGPETTASVTVSPSEAAQPPPDRPAKAESDEAPEIAEAAGPVATATASVFESLRIGEEVAMAAAGTGAAATNEGAKQNSRRTILILGVLIVLAIIVALILIYIFTLS